MTSHICTYMKPPKNAKPTPHKIGDYVEISNTAFIY